MGWGPVSCDSIPGGCSLKWKVFLGSLRFVGPRARSYHPAWGPGCNVRAHSGT